MTGQALGLTAAELADVLAELTPELAGSVVDGVGLLREQDDLLLFVRVAEGGAVGEGAVGEGGGETGRGRRRALHVVPGGPRGRVCWTRRRFPRTAFQQGPLPDRVAELLTGSRFESFAQPEGERRFRAAFARAPDPPIGLEVELFGNRGLWCLVDDARRILSLSRLPKSRTRDLRPGAGYVPPAGGKPAPASPAAAAGPRFAPPRSDAIDRYFTELDETRESHTEHEVVAHAVRRGVARLGARVDGLAQKLATMTGAAELQLQADMLLAYGHTWQKGATELRVPHPAGAADEVLVVPLDPRRPPHVQAAALYDKARRYRDGAGKCEQQLAAARADLARLSALCQDLEGIGTPAAAEVGDPAGGDASAGAEVLRRARALCEELSLMPRRPERVGPVKRPDPLAKITRGIPFRRFESAEGYLILVGRSNEQNDRLTRSVARGGDLWFHVGRGYAGSHVVLRLPKGKTASLDSLLDAATLAVHFSKARGAEQIDVTHALAKHVTKPKGLPPGKVIVHHEKTLRVRMEPSRLRRLLDSAQQDQGLA